MIDFYRKEIVKQTSLSNFLNKNCELAAKKSLLVLTKTQTLLLFSYYAKLQSHKNDWKLLREYCQNYSIQQELLQKVTDEATAINFLPSLKISRISLEENYSQLLQQLTGSEQNELWEKVLNNIPFHRLEREELICLKEAVLDETTQITPSNTASKLANERIECPPVSKRPFFFSTSAGTSNPAKKHVKRLNSKSERKKIKFVNSVLNEISENFQEKKLEPNSGF